MQKQEDIRAYLAMQIQHKKRQGDVEHGRDEKSQKEMQETIQQDQAAIAEAKQARLKALMNDPELPPEYVAKIARAVGVRTNNFVESPRK